jgi:hypothetical protein
MRRYPWNRQGKRRPRGGVRREWHYWGGGLHGPPAARAYLFVRFICSVQEHPERVRERTSWVAVLPRRCPAAPAPLYPPLRMWWLWPAYTCLGSALEIWCPPPPPPTSPASGQPLRGAERRVNAHLVRPLTGPVQSGGAAQVASESRTGKHPMGS